MRPWAKPCRVSRVITLRRSHTTPLCGRLIDTSPSASGHRRGDLPAGPAENIGDQLGQHAPPALSALAGGDFTPAAAAEPGGDAAAASADRLSGGIQARQRGEGTATGARAGAQPGLQVAVFAGPSFRPGIGAARVTLAAARTRREPGRIR